MVVVELCVCASVRYVGWQSWRGLTTQCLHSSAEAIHWYSLTTTYL
jgi:hypothetical protein